MPMALTSASRRTGSGSELDAESRDWFDTDFAATKFYSDAADTVVVDDEYCQFNATETKLSGCKAPRGCRACLRVTGCMINSNAQCMSVAQHYNKSLDFRGATLYTNKSLHIKSSVNLLDHWNASSNPENWNTSRDPENWNTSRDPENWIFPSTVVNYCGSNDTVCETCRSTLFANATDGGDMRFCVGKRGCVCIQRCDGAVQDKLLSDMTVCTKTVPKKDVLPAALMWILGSTIAIVLCTSLYYWIYRRTRDPENGKDNEEEEEEGRLDILFSKDGTTSTSKGFPGGRHPETPVMELSRGSRDAPRFTLIDSSRRQDMFVLSESENEW